MASTFVVGLGSKQHFGALTHTHTHTGQDNGAANNYYPTTCGHDEGKTRTVALAADLSSQTEHSGTEPERTGTHTTTNSTTTEWIGLRFHSLSKFSVGGFSGAGKFGKSPSGADDTRSRKVS